MQPLMCQAGVVVTERSEFPGEDGKPRFMLTVAGLGWQQNIVTQHKSETVAWPTQGEEVLMQADLRVQKGGGFRLANVRFVSPKK